LVEDYRLPGHCHGGKKTIKGLPVWKTEDRRAGVRDGRRKEREGRRRERKRASKTPGLGGKRGGGGWRKSVGGVAEVPARWGWTEVGANVRANWGDALVFHDYVALNFRQLITQFP